MAARLLFGASVAFVIFFMAEGGCRKSCEYVFPHFAGYHTPIKTSLIVNGTNTVNWTLLTSTGTTIHLGTCNGTFNCSTSDSRISQLRQSRSESVITFSKNSPSVRGELICEETLTNGTVLTGVFQLKIVRIQFNPQYDMKESKPFRTIVCSTSPFTPSTVSWTLNTFSGQSLDLGTCTSDGTCTSPHAPGFSLLSIRPRRGVRINYVSFKHIDRSKAGRVFCSLTYNGSTETSNSTLNFYNPAIVNNCHAQIRHQNWSTIVWCDVSDMFSSVGTYEFKVFSKAGRDKSGFVFEGRRSFRDMLTPYTNSTDNKVYYRGRLTYSWPLSPEPSSYLGFAFYLYYGSEAYTKEGADYRLNVTRPSQPTHNCSELNYIPETGVVPCVCTADYLGSPPGRLVWLLRNVPIATGDYGVTQLTFPSGHVSRQYDGMMVTCKLDWVQPINAAFTSNVSFIPSQPTHNCSELNYIPETGVVPCVCTADYMGSPAGRLVWLLGNITMATGDYGVTQLTFPSGHVSRQHDGMMVTCQLDWVQPISAAFIDHVAYGPDLVTLRQYTTRFVTSNALVQVTSHVTEMKPMTSDMVQWGGLCQGQQGFMCTLTPRSAAEVDGKTVTCRVTNAANNGHSAEASVVIRMSEDPDGVLSLEKDELFLEKYELDQDFRAPRVVVKVIDGREFCWLVAVGVVSHIALVIFIVLFVLTRRNQLLSRPEYNTSKQPLLAAVGYQTYTNPKLVEHQEGKL